MAETLPALLLLLQAGCRAWVLWTFLAALRLPAVAAEGRVTLILPLTGPAPGLEDLFAALAAQSLPPARLLVTVEAAEDPAAARACACAPLLPCPVEIVVAGRADTRGQKNTNLIAALARIGAGDEAILLLDADIRPQPWWLSALATPVLRDEADLVTGYRWPLAGAAPIPALWTALDRGFALMPKPAALGFAWGGSLCLSPAALARLDLPRRLDRALSDDMVIGSAAAALGLRILRRRALLLPTPSEGAVLPFARRQFQIMRVYAPLWWALGAVGTLAGLAVWIGAMHAAFTGSVLAWLAMLFAIIIGALRWAAHRRVAATIGAPPDAPAASALQLALAALPPLTEAFAATLFAASAWPRIIRWRHLDYAVAGPHAVRVTARRAP